MTYRLLITDLDNTLYDWVTFFAQSFSIMVEVLNEITGIPVDTLLDEFKTIHQKYQNSEHPFAVLELPSVRARYPGLTPAELRREIDPALHAFNSVRKQLLSLYPCVFETLELLKSFGIQIVGHTEATAPNALFRLRKLGILSLFDRLYALESPISFHPFPERVAQLGPPLGFVSLITREQKKPNSELLLDICLSLG